MQYTALIFSRQLTSHNFEIVYLTFHNIERIDENQIQALVLYWCIVIGHIYMSYFIHFKFIWPSESVLFFLSRNILYQEGLPLKIFITKKSCQIVARRIQLLTQSDKLTLKSVAKHWQFQSICSIPFNCFLSSNNVRRFKRIKPNVWDTYSRAYWGITLLIITPIVFI